MDKKKSLASKIKTLSILTVILALIGVFLLVQSYSTAQLSPEIESSQNKSFFAGIIIVLSIFLIFQLMVIMSLKRALTIIEQSNSEILGTVISLKSNENDEIKELVATRNMLLMKLEDNKKAIEKVKVTKKRN
jgi:hypothetical protein